MNEKSRLLPREFFLPPPDIVARELLGKLLVRVIETEAGSERLVGRIVETEAYFGVDDPAAHSFAGRTARTEVLWRPPGHAYVYFIYGMHSCLNVSCEPEGTAGCVLIRALAPVQGRARMAALRGLAPDIPDVRLTSGPGRLCGALAITRAGLNGADLLSEQSELQIREDGWQAEAQCGVSPRIGITKAADRPLRFFVAGERCVSGPRKFTA